MAFLIPLLLACGLQARAAAVPAPFSTGQIIGISEALSDPSTLLFEGFTASRYGHVGVVSVEEGGVFVYHAAPPAVQKARLDDFLLRGRDARGEAPYTLVEPARPLSPRERAALVESMEAMRGKVPYNRSMVANDCSVNCSEFARKAFQSIGREDVGVPEPLSGMNAESFSGLLAEAWRRATGTDLPPGDSLGVSPASVVNSPGMRVVRAGLPVERLLDDRELYEAWRLAGALEAFSKIFHIPARRLRRAARKGPYREYPSNWRGQGPN